jgi:hypothetical protein
MGPKIVILGNSGSGKSTLARQLAAEFAGRSPHAWAAAFDPMLDPANPAANPSIGAAASPAVDPAGNPAISIKPSSLASVQPGDEAGAGAILDLDTIVWEPQQIAVRRSPAAIWADLARFCAMHDRWIVEGCYGDVVQGLLERDRPVLVFLNPGEAVCLQHCRDRPWEPHKYASKAEQDRYLAGLLEWVADYYRREGDLALAGHRRCFAAYDGPKREFVELTDAATAIWAMVGAGDGGGDRGDRGGAG